MGLNVLFLGGFDLYWTVRTKKKRKRGDAECDMKPYTRATHSQCNTPQTKDSAAGEMSQCANDRAAEAQGRFPSPAGGSDQTGFLQLDAYEVADQVEINATGC